MLDRDALAYVPHGVFFNGQHSRATAFGDVAGKPGGCLKADNLGNERDGVGFEIGDQGRRRLCEDFDDGRVGPFCDPFRLARLGGHFRNDHGRGASCKLSRSAGGGKFARQSVAYLKVRLWTWAFATRPFQGREVFSLIMSGEGGLAGARRLTADSAL